MTEQTPLTPERWREIERLFSEIEERPTDRAALLAAADPAVRAEVEKMVAASEVASLLDDPPMPTALRPSDTLPNILGPYRIDAPLGHGGMGRVFRATDTRLNRAVAIKIPAKQFSERFEREARAIARLNHPNICTLHDVGPDYLVMELVAGQTLAARLERGRLSLEETVRYGAQIASALAAAHAQGIVHRDLKPANIMLSKTSVKLMDFGLSQSREDVHVTAACDRMGTPAYMAPEQFEGHPADTRSDIYALGLVLFEMAAGKRPSPETPSPIPPTLDRVVKRCLEEDPDNRWQSARDLEWELESVLDAPSISPARPRTRILGATLGLGVLLLAGLAVLQFTAKPSEQPSVLMSIELPEKSRVGSLAVSPDGRRLAMVLVKEGMQQLWIRALNSLDLTPLAGTENAARPFWSPDGRYIAFFADAELKKVEASGGPVQALCDAQGGKGGTWNREGEILFSTDALGRVLRIPDTGGTPSQAPYHPDAEAFFPVFLPDGHSYLIQRGRTPGAANAGIWLFSTANAGARRILADLSEPEFVQPAAGSRIGHVLFTRGGSLMALPFDTKRLEAAGNPFPVAQHANGPWTSSPGLLAYVSSKRAGWQYAWRDRQGKTLGAFGEAGGALSISFDGKQVVGDHDGIETMSSAGGQLTRLTFGGKGQDPVWSPDGRYVSFACCGGIFRKLATGAGAQELLIATPVLSVPLSWSPDGRFLLFVQLNSLTAADLMALPVEGDRKPLVLVQTPANENQGQFSPDGKYMAYTSNESGLSEIYVIPFPPSLTGGRWLVSKGGGVMPRWRRDGKELFYISPDNEMMSVEVTTQPVFSAGTPRRLFQTGIVDTGIRNGPMSWDVAPDGRFLIITDTSVDTSVTAILNWRPPHQK